MNQNTNNDYTLEDEEEELELNQSSDDNSSNDYPLDSKNQNKRHSPLRLLLTMMINPVEGWKKIRRSNFKSETVAKNCFFPITALAACSCFMEAVYNSAMTLNECVISAVIIFMSLFFGNFLTLLLIKFSFPKEYQPIADSNFGKVFVMYNLSTLGLFYILYELLPMIGPVIVFLPLWTIYLAMRGCRFFRFPAEKGNLLTTLICLYLLGAPIAVYWAFDIIL